MFKVGITGADGFIGYHLTRHLKDKAEIVPVDHAEVIVHLAGVNRGDYDVNITLAEDLLKYDTRIIYASTIQEGESSIYGRSKLRARKILERRGNVTSLIIPNVFGEYCKPFYNSVVATFCHQLTHQEMPTLLIDRELPLIYVNNLCKVIWHEIKNSVTGVKVVEVKEDFRMSVKELLAELQRYESGVFTGDLYRTYISYKDIKTAELDVKEDKRGVFVECIKGCGQVSYSTTLPGITRGNHYHTTKIERFIILDGMAEIRMRKIGDSKVITNILRENNYIDIPVYHTHNVTNTGEGKMKMLIWASEIYNDFEPDTIMEDV